MQSFVHKVHLEEIFWQCRVGGDPHEAPRLFDAYFEARCLESAIVVDNIGTTEKDAESISSGMGSGQEVGSHILQSQGSGDFVPMTTIPS